jgi:hypothetical protein
MRITEGKAVVIDLRQSADQAGVRPKAAFNNARMEGRAGIGKTVTTVVFVTFSTGEQCSFYRL